MKISKMKLWSNGNIRAFFDLETEEGIIIKGFKVVDGSNGLFVGFPASKGKDDNWYDDVYMSKEMKISLNNLAIDFHNKLLNESENSIRETTEDDNNYYGENNPMKDLPF